MIIGVTIVILVAALAIAGARYGAAVRSDAVAVDFAFWNVIAERWLATGSMYTPAQLAGPYDPHALIFSAPNEIPSLYPPPAILWFLPFLYLPPVLWWAIPLGFLAYAIVRLQPAAWSWPVMAALLVFPSFSSTIIVGNTTMWIAAFLAGGLLYSWPAMLILVKPALAPFALVGIRRRSWWIALAVWCLVSLFMLDQWFEYVTAMRNVQSTFLYSLDSVPFLLVPIVAWLGRRVEHVTLPGPAGLVRVAVPVARP
jgi:hypothetical protein